MNSYFIKKRWKLSLVFLALLIGASSLLYTSWLVKRLAEEEKKKVLQWYDAMDKVLKASDTEDISFFSRIMSDNTTTPMIITDQEGNVVSDRNIQYTDETKDKKLREELELMTTYNQPFEIVLSETQSQFLYYRESYLLRNLRIFPFIQLIIICIFVGLSYFGFSSSRRAEQNQVWVGMSKETAHQLGTPISSLMAITELLKMGESSDDLVRELEKDYERLSKIAERFSKIGSEPELFPTDLIDCLNTTISYLKTRTSANVEYDIRYDENQAIVIPLNPSLFTWVIENISKNAIDAMDNKGRLSFNISERENNIFIDISDTGKGISRSMQKTIFKPGFTTKRRGWGLGLSLVKRIVEEYHKGRVYVKWSELNKGTKFRISLNKDITDIRSNKLDMRLKRLLKHK
ncbi:MAG: sensor histidine kinase [Bacteroidales bacterium]